MSDNPQALALARRHANLEMLLDVMRKARAEGWHEKDPGWRLADDLIARIDGLEVTP